MTLGWQATTAILTAVSLACAVSPARAQGHRPAPAEERPRGPAEPSVSGAETGESEAVSQGSVDAPAPPVPTRYRQARAHFDRGVASALASDWPGAAAAFEASAKLVPRQVTLFNLALAQVELSQPVEAARSLDRYLERARADGQADAEELAQAKALRRELSGHLASVSVELSPAHATLRWNGAAVDPAHLPLLLPPGEHQLDAHAEGHRSVHHKLTLHPGQVRSVALQLAPLPVATPQSRKPIRPAPSTGVGQAETPSVWQSPWLWTGVAGAIAAAVLAGVLLGADGDAPTEPYGGSTGHRL